MLTKSMQNSKPMSLFLDGNDHMPDKGDDVTLLSSLLAFLIVVRKKCFLEPRGKTGQHILDVFERKI